MVTQNCWRQHFFWWRHHFLGKISFFSLWHNLCIHFEFFVENYCDWEYLVSKLLIFVSYMCYIYDFCIRLQFFVPKHNNDLDIFFMRKIKWISKNINFDNKYNLRKCKKLWNLELYFLGSSFIHTPVTIRYSCLCQQFLIRFKYTQR